MSKRRKLTRDERYATVVLMLKRGDGRPIVTLDEARALSPREIIEAFERRIQWDHATPHALGGSYHPTNMTPMVPEDHKPKTRRDVKAIAKSKRITAKRARELPARIDVRGEMGERSERTSEPPRRRGRPMAGSKASGWRKKMNGKVERR